MDGIDVKRVVFHEVTKNAVIILANPRELNQELIDAYLARRALDYLSDSAVAGRGASCRVCPPGACSRLRCG